MCRLLDGQDSVWETFDATDDDHAGHCGWVLSMRRPHVAPRLGVRGDSRIERQDSDRCPSVLAWVPGA